MRRANSFIVQSVLLVASHVQSFLNPATRMNVLRNVLKYLSDSDSLYSSVIIVRFIFVFLNFIFSTLFNQLYDVLKMFSDPLGKFVWRMPRILGFTVYLLVFLTLLTLFSYCAHLVGGST